MAEMNENGFMDSEEKTNQTEVINRPGPMESGGGHSPMDDGEGFGFTDRRTMKILLVVTPLLIAVFSLFILSKYATSVSFHAGTIASLDEKKATVLQLTAVSTGASAAITLIPGDVATPIADKLADLSSYFIIVLCAIYLEKYLLTITGYAAFSILIPLGCVLCSVHFLWPGSRLIQIGKKLILFGIAIVLVIPASVGVSNMIENTYSESIELTMQQALQTTSEVTESFEDTSEVSDRTNEDESGLVSAAGERTQEEDKGWLQNFISNTAESVTSTVQEAVDSTVNGVETKISEFKTMLNNMLEALAVMIVTSCLIPIIVLLFFVWLIKVILNVNVSIPPMGRPGGIGHRPS